MPWELAVPYDVALVIASFLQVPELCSLGSCSRFWRELCSSDFIWVSLSRERWPSIDFCDEIVRSDERTSENMGWKVLYIKWHKVMAGRATGVVQLVKQCSQSGSLEVADYLRAIKELCSTKLAFRDVQLFLFTTEHDVLLNLIGVHYCLFGLGVPAEDVCKALSISHISERQVCVRWWKLGRWFQGFRLRDESRCRRFTLGNLAMAKEEEVMGVLLRGAIHEVLRVQISSRIESPSWVSIHS
ncbi:hypothetical protein H6P81_002104 [Aristolochia fimbriata]|uniref:F-box domain-containing protein n=1 Tax=Aristolochia fimbriata TaxID=158543 RepID=A0AAV7FA14_ARIFI|nr:hypothetical protein H6P81_002104 [Aristolochia fimbriata]